MANLRVAGGVGVLEAGSDVFPNDPRPVAFAVDCRIRDGRVRAVIPTPGSMAGVVLRRASPRDYYAAVYDPQQAQLSILRRSGAELVTLAQTAALVPGEIAVELAAAGAAPTTLTATLTAAGMPLVAVSAQDGHPALQGAGDAGVLTRAQTLFPSAGPPVLPSLGNLHLLPYGTEEGEAFLESPAGQVIIDEIRRQSTATFREVTISSTEVAQPTPASVIAATTGLPRADGARLHLAADLPADVVIETSATPGFEHPRRLMTGSTSAFDGLAVTARGLPPGRRAYWRATLHRAGTAQPGPVRSFRVLPGRGDPRRVRVAMAACAAQFGPLFGDLAKARPDVLVWQGDLNYPDTVGPLAQSMSGYAGIWRDFLANPLMAPVFERSAFVAVRDDHDYGVQDANSTLIPAHPWAIGPWDALMGDGIGYRFSAGLADVWVLDQRRHKSDPAAPDDEHKTLLGERQRDWLLAGLRSSTAPFKVICSPCTVFMPANRRDGNWATNFTTERNAILDHIDHEVSGQVLFVTGDTHLTGVFDDGRRYEARPCPLGIPVPNDITISDPDAGDRLRKTPGVTYADERCHFALLDIHGDGDTATLELSLLREDGTTPYRKTFTQQIPPARLRVAVDRRLRVSVRLDRPGLVRVRATLDRVSRIADRAVRFPRAGTRRFRLRVRRRGRLTVTARYRSPTGRLTVARVRRALRRRVR